MARRRESNNAAGLVRTAALVIALVAGARGAVADATLAASVARPLSTAGSGIVNSVKVGSAGVVTDAALPTVGDLAGAAGSHSPAFEDFMRKFEKAETYCPGSMPPCDESLRREKVFHANVAAIEAHNAARGGEGSEEKGGMKMGVTRFADLTEDEFSKHHGKGFNAMDKEEEKGAGDEGVSASRAEGEKEAKPKRSATPLGEVKQTRAKLGAGGGLKVPKHHNWPLHDLGDDIDDRSAEEIAADESIPVAIVELARKRLKDGRKHCRRFMKFVHQYGKQKQYCGDMDAFPCEESHRREIILLRNIEQIEAHNAKRKKGGMRKIVTRFADLLPEEFASAHATYAAGNTLKDHLAKTKDAKKSVKDKTGRKTLERQGDKVKALHEEKAVHEEKALHEEKAVHEERTKSLSAKVGKHTDHHAKEAALGAAEPTELRDMLRAARQADAEAKSYGVKMQINDADIDEDLRAAISSDLELQSTAVAVSKPRSASRLGAMKKALPKDIDLPKTLDWRQKMDIGPLYSQGACSGCWAYSTVQVIADSKLIGTGHRPSPSPYYLLSCDELDSGCNTGNMATAYAWIQVQQHGILSVEDFPTASDRCMEAESNDKAKGVTIDGFCEIPPLRGAETVYALLRALYQQPVAIGMNVKPLQLYGGGLVTMEDCPPASSDQINAINHAAVVVGWGEDEESGKPYFLVKNSYGQDWGENGYARLEMAYDGDSMYGACGMFAEQNYPLTDGRDCTEGSEKKWSELRGDDVYLMPDNVVILPDGGGILTPARIKVFGYDLTAILKTASFVCFALCVFFLGIEIYYCFVPEQDGDSPRTPAPGHPQYGAAGK